MAKEYQVNGMTRFVNRLMARMVRWNLAPSQTYLLTVRGQKSGIAYSVPVRLIEMVGKRFLVSPYGEVSWVKNARAGAIGEVSLARGRNTERYKILELNPQERAPVLREHVTRDGIVRPYFDAQSDSPLEAFENEATIPPVLLLETL